MEERWHPQQLTRAQLEERRLAAAKQLEAGASRPQIKAEFGVSYTTIQRWVTRLEVEGEAAPAGNRVEWSPNGVDRGAA